MHVKKSYFFYPITYKVDRKTFLKIAHAMPFWDSGDM